MLTRVYVDAKRKLVLSAYMLPSGVWIQMTCYCSCSYCAQLVAKQRVR